MYELNANIAENSIYGTEIAKLKAFDLDLDRNLTFKVSNSSKNEFIAINEQTGWLMSLLSKIKIFNSIFQFFKKA